MFRPWHTRRRFSVSLSGRTRKRYYARDTKLGVDSNGSPRLKQLLTRATLCSSRPRKRNCENPGKVWCHGRTSLLRIARLFDEHE
jgi:hypothetical protein